MACSGPWKRSEPGSAKSEPAIGCVLTTWTGYARRCATIPAWAAGASGRCRAPGEDLPLLRATIDLIAVLAELNKRYGRSPTYQQLWQAAVAGRVPARRVGRYWQFRLADVPAVALAMGLISSSDTAA